MLPPTYCTCLEMFDFARPADALAAADGRDLSSVEPQAVIDDEGAYLSIPDRLVRLGEDVVVADAPVSGWSGGTFGERARCVLAPNPDVMTLDGTNTWVLREPDGARSVVVDPGPEIAEHLDPVASYAGEVAVVLLTHGHLDHSEAARSFAERVGLRRAGARPAAPARRRGARGRRRGRGRRARGARRRHARPHLGLAVVRAAPGARCADRRHGARPRYDGRGAPGRPARGLPRLAAPAARPGRGAGGHARSGRATAR